MYPLLMRSLGNKYWKLTFVVALSIAMIPANVVPSSAASSSAKVRRSTTFVGPDVHTLTYTNDGLFMTGHESGSLSKDEGVTWNPISSFKNKDIMDWAITNAGYLAGGHDGLFKSTNGGKTFTQISFYGHASDVHSLGATGQIVYMGSPQVGFLSSANSGKTWKIVNSKFGHEFMGSMLVDPSNPLRVIASDMSNGLVITTDGGKTWKRFSGPSGVMSIDWIRKDPKVIVALSMGTGSLTKDGGKTWSTFTVPMGAEAIALSPTGSKISIAVLGSQGAGILSSVDGGKNWL